MGVGAVIVQTLAFEGGDRESVHRVREASDKGLHYVWAFEEVHAAGDTLRSETRYLEGWADLVDAKRLRVFHSDKAPEAHPGYTMHALSRAVYRGVRAAKAESLQVMALDKTETIGSKLGFGGGAPRPVRWRGTVSLATPGTVPFPVLLNGRRVHLPSLHLRGDFTARQGRWQPQLWVLADSVYPLILKWVGAHREEKNVLQTTRIDLPTAVVGLEAFADPGTLPAGGGGGLLLGEAGLLPDGTAIVAGRGGAAAAGAAGGGTIGGGGGGGGKGGARALEQALTASCRVELPGIYFAFNSARLEPASDRAIATIAEVLARHPEWKGMLEGHTDSVGSATANQKLSERRVEAVRARLVEAHKLDPARLRVSGHGAARPKEPNATIEGRARNRRVELVRDC